MASMRATFAAALFAALCASLTACQANDPAAAGDAAAGEDAAASDDASQNDSTKDEKGSGLPAAASGGYCCPIGMPTCDCFPNGGWTAVDDESHCPKICDMAPPAQETTDQHGCKVLWGPGSCIGPHPDAGADADADAPDSTLPVAPDGGFCCPIEPATCNCFANGGWVSKDDPKSCPNICDMAPPGHVETDPHGCSILVSPNSCLDWDSGTD